MTLAVTLAALTPLGAQAQAQADPIQAVKKYVDTANTGDFDKTLVFYADDAVIKLPFGLGVFVGKEQIAKWLEQDVKTTRAAPKTWEMQGPVVVNTGVVALDMFTQAGVPHVEYRSEYIVGPDGKIRFFAPVPMPTPEQAAKLSAPPAAKPKVDPIKVAQAYMRAVNSGNVNASTAFYAPNGAMLVLNGARLLNGKPQIDEFHKTEVKTTRSKPEKWEMQGGTVINTGLVSMERLRTLGMEWVPYRTEYVIEGGKIRFFRGMLLLTPEQQAKVAATSVSK